MELIYCLFFGRYSSACADAGMPYLYIGSIVLMLALLYFMGNDSTRAKFAGAFLLAGVGASYLVNLPGLTWQNGDDLAVFPFRYGFLLSAMLLILAADTVIHDPPPISSLAAAMFVLAIYLLGYHGTVGAAARTWRLAIRGRAVSGLLSPAADAGTALPAEGRRYPAGRADACRCGGQQLHHIVWSILWI